MSDGFRVVGEGPYPYFVTCSIIRWYPVFVSGAIFKQAQADNNKLLVWLFRNEVKDEPKLKCKVLQDEFHPEGIKSPKFFIQKANYIHMNPVNKGLVADSVNYYYSSAAAFEGIETGPLEIDWLEW